jgi:hypothetical protein
MLSTLQIFYCVENACGIVFKEADCHIAAVTQKTADRTARVVMIDVQVLQKTGLVSSAFRSLAIAPMTNSDRTPLTLLLQETL